MSRYVQRGRDVVALIQQQGWERGGMKALVNMAEDLQHVKQELADALVIINKMADIVATTTAVSAKLRDDLGRMQERYHPNNDANPDKKWSS